MKQRGNSRFQRARRSLQTRKLVVVAAEGAVTERTYLETVIDCFRSQKKKVSGVDAAISFRYVGKGNNCAPIKRLNALKKVISTDNIDDNYSAWLLCDLDEWGADQFAVVQKWVDEKPDRNHWILSSPNFEYWLSLHFAGAEESRIFFSRYSKRIRKTDFNYEQIISACKRARSSFSGAASLLEQKGSGMFMLVEHIAEILGLEEDFK